MAKATKTKAKATETVAEEVTATAAETATEQVAQGPVEGQTEQQQQAVVTLFGQIGFATIAEFDAYIARMKQSNYNDILVTINVALRSLSQRGAFSLEENEAVSAALRNLNAAFTVQQPEEAAPTA